MLAQNMCESSHEWKIMGNSIRNCESFFSTPARNASCFRSFVAAHTGFSFEPFHKSNSLLCTHKFSFSRFQICWKIYIIFLSTFMRGWFLKHVEGNDAYIKRGQTEKWKVRISFCVLLKYVACLTDMSSFATATLKHY